MLEIFNETLKGRNKTLIKKDFEDLIEYIDNVRFFTPSLPLTRKIVSRLGFLKKTEKSYLKQEVENRIDDEESLNSQQKMIAEQFYSYLAMKSDTSDALRGEKLLIKEVIGFGMCKAIGLSDEKEDESLLFKLVDEFSDWIEQERFFYTGWGSIKSGGSGLIYLERKNNEIIDSQPNRIPRGRTRSFKQKAHKKAAR